jgi:hypothetical protein
MLNHLGEGKVWQSGFSFSAHHQTIRNQLPNDQLSMEIQGIQAQLGFRINYLPGHIKCTPSVFYNLYDLPGRVQKRIGAGLILQKGFFENKLKAGLSTRFAKNVVDGQPNGNTLNLRLTGSWLVTKQHSLDASFALLDKSAVLSPAYTESRSTLRYGFRF